MSGFSLAELLLSLFVINVAVLALVMGGAFVVRETNELRARGGAIEAATNRLNVLAAGPCALRSGDTTYSRSEGIVESWAVAVLTNRVLDVADSVTYLVRGARRSLVVRTRVSC